MASISDRGVKLYRMFPIEGVTRTDLISIGGYTEEEVLRLTDDDMERVAAYLSTVYYSFRGGLGEEFRVAVEKAIERRENRERRTP